MNENKFALITGASAGIGAEYARQLALEWNYNLIVAARRGDQLEELKNNILKQCGDAARKPEIITITAGLSKSEGVMDLIAAVDKRGVNIDLLVNNAGFGSLTEFANSSIGWETDMVRVNCLAPMILTHHFLPKMIQRQSLKGGQECRGCCTVSGHDRCGIINVCSTAAFQPIPVMATYGATKSFLYSFTRAVAKEAEDAGVTITASCPGPTSSDFGKVIGLDSKVPVMPGMTAQAVVRQALRGFHRGKKVVIHGLFNKLCVFLSNYLPTSLTLSMLMKAKKGRLVVRGKPL